MSARLFFLFAILVLTGTSSFSQSIHPELIGKKMSAAIKLEQKMKAKVYTSDEDIIVPGGMAVPIRYIRPEKNIPDLIIEYTFSEKDSIIRRIAYEWDVRNFEKTDHNVKPLTFDKALIFKYNSLYNFLTERYGAGMAKGDLSALAKIEEPDGLNRSDTWMISGQLDVSLYTALSNYYKQEGALTHIPTHRIRLYFTEARH